MTLIVSRLEWLTSLFLFIMVEFEKVLLIQLFYIGMPVGRASVTAGVSRLPQFFILGMGLRLYLWSSHYNAFLR